MTPLSNQRRFFMRWFEAKYQANEFNDDKVSGNKLSEHGFAR
jgi:hypothetical protein